MEWASIFFLDPLFNASHMMVAMAEKLSKIHSKKRKSSNKKNLLVKSIAGSNKEKRPKAKVSYKRNATDF